MLEGGGMSSFLVGFGLLPLRFLFCFDADGLLRRTDMQ